VAAGLIAIGKVLVAVALGLVALAWLLQERLIFHPQPGAAKNAAAQSIFMKAGDGTRLHAWHVKGNADSPLVIYFGGNAENVSWMIDAVQTSAPGVGWLLVDYRGYGSSEGSPSEAALGADALGWFDEFSAKTKTIHVFGRSLGSGVAVHLAAERPVAGVVLVSPFDSLVDVAQRHYPFLPVSWLLRHRFDSVARAPRIKAPLLCLVAQRDEVIPAVHSRRLYEAWGGPKRWVDLAGAGHNSTDGVSAFWPAVRSFVEKQ
jgi:uncharacterized protein